MVRFPKLNGWYWRWVFDTRKTKTWKLLKPESRSRVRFEYQRGEGAGAVTAFQERTWITVIRWLTLPTTFKSVENKQQYKSGELHSPMEWLLSRWPKGTCYRVVMKYVTPQNNITINTRGLEFDLNLGRFDAIRTAFRSMAPGYGQNGSSQRLYLLWKRLRRSGKAPHGAEVAAAMRKNYSRKNGDDRVTRIWYRVWWHCLLKVLWKEAKLEPFRMIRSQIEHISKEDGRNIFRSG